MSTLLDLIRESILTQALLTLSVTGVVLYLYLSGQAVPDTLVQVWSLIVGFYFGSKVQQAIHNLARKG